MMSSAPRSNRKGGRMTDNFARAQRNWDRMEPDDFQTFPDKLEPTLREKIIAWLLANGDARIAATRLEGLADFLIDQHGLDKIEDARVLPTDPTAVQTIERWITGGTGPRDFDYNDFDARR
jgi:hypothetical protein